MVGQGAGSRLTEQERRRRASIARRYVAIEAPTKVDDEAYAKELGLSVDSLWRLARAWRIGAASDTVEGSTAAARSLALRAARDPDLSQVSPSRRPLVEARLRVVAEHLAIAKPTAADLAAGAASLELTTQSFRRLLRIWVRHRNPALLPGGSTPMRNTRYERREIGSRETYMARALANLGTQVSSMALHREVVRLCEADGVAPPGQPTTYNRLMRARAEASNIEGEPGFALDHSAISLAVDPADGGGPTLAVLSMLFARCSGRIVAHSVSLDAPSPDRTVALLRRAASVLPSGIEELTLGIPSDPEWQVLRQTLIADGVAAAPVSPGRLAAGALATRRFGDLIGTLRLRPGHTRAPRKARLTRVMGADAPLTMHEARAAVDDAIRIHNDGRAEPLAGFIPASGSRSPPGHSDGPASRRARPRRSRARP